LKDFSFLFCVLKYKSPYGSDSISFRGAESFPSGQSTVKKQSRAGDVQNIFITLSQQQHKKKAVIAGSNPALRKRMEKTLT